jgi:hypothetical protein
VVAEIGRNPGERAGVEASPPGDGDHGINQIIELGFEVIECLAVGPRVPAAQQLPGAIDLTFGVGGILGRLEGIRTSDHSS